MRRVYNRLIIGQVIWLQAILHWRALINLRPALSKIIEKEALCMPNDEKMCVERNDMRSETVSQREICQHLNAFARRMAKRLLFAIGKHGIFITTSSSNLINNFIGHLHWRPQSSTRALSLFSPIPIY